MMFMTTLSTNSASSISSSFRYLLEPFTKLQRSVVQNDNAPQLMQFGKQTQGQCTSPKAYANVVGPTVIYKLERVYA